MMKISVVYPAYNESEIIRRTVMRSIDALKERGFEEFEIVIVNDGSRDDTGKQAERLAKEFPSVVVSHNPVNMGVGETLFRGLMLARHPLVLHNGMDYPFDLVHLDKMIPLIGNYDVVVAGRTSWSGYSFYRYLVSRANRLLLRMLLRLPIRDCNFVQLYKREVIHAAKPRSRAAGFIVPEMLARAYARGYRLVEVAIPYGERETGTSIVGNPRILWDTFRDLVSFWWTYRVLGRND